MPLVFSILVYGVYRLLVFLSVDRVTASFIFLLPIALLLFNFTLRKKLRYKDWFLSPWNFLLDKESFELKSDLPINLIVPKIEEVISQSKYKLLDSQESKSIFLLGTSISFWTWGENIYLEIKEENEGCSVELTSVTIFGSFSWGKNDKNFATFSEVFEQSLTI